MRRPARAHQSGFALIAAVFLLVVIAALGAFALRLNMTQQSSIDLDLAVARADAAVQTGIQYAAARFAGATTCSGSTVLSLPQNFTVTVACSPATVVANTPTVTVFLVTVSATRGGVPYGSPEFVSRQRAVRITPL